MTDTQVWPEVVLTRTLDKKEDWTAQINVSGRFGNGLRTVTDARIGAALARRATKHISVGGFYLYRYNNSTLISSSYAHRMGGFVQASVPLGEKWSVNGRSLISYEMRLSRRNDTAFRNRIGVKRKLTLAGRQFEAVGTLEHFYSITFSRGFRYRSTLGISRSINKRVAVDLLYVRQDDITRPRNINAFSPVIRIKL